MKTLALALATAQQVLPVDLCTDPHPAMATVIGLLDTAAANKQLSDGDRAKATDAMCYLAERIVALMALVDPSTLPVSSSFVADAIPRGEAG